MSLTRGQVLDDDSSSGVEDDVSAIVEVMQVVATVEASVAKNVLQQQLLKTNREIHTAAHCDGGLTED